MEKIFRTKNGKIVKLSVSTMLDDRYFVVFYNDNFSYKLGLTSWEVYWYHAKCFIDVKSALEHLETIGPPPGFECIVGEEKNSSQEFQISWLSPKQIGKYIIGSWDRLYLRVETS